jgi:hypothetical protein
MRASPLATIEPGRRVRCPRASSRSGPHFAESTAFPPLGIVVLGDETYLLGDEFSAADVMMGFTLVAARLLGVLDDRFRALQRDLARLEARPAFQKAAALSQPARAARNRRWRGPRARADRARAGRARS